MTYKGEILEMGYINFDQMLGLELLNMTKWLLRSENKIEPPWYFSFYYTKSGTKKPVWSMNDDNSLLEFLELWEDEDVVKLEMKETLKPSELCTIH